MANDQVETSSPNQELGVSLEDIGPARRCLTIDIPAERITEKIESNYSQLMTDAVIPGFRKGRVPRQLLIKRFGTTVKEDSRNQLLGECYDQAIKDQELDVIGEPDIKDFDEIKLPESGPLQFKVEVEISPKVELPDLEGIQVNRPELESSKKQTDEEIKRLQQRLGRVKDTGDDPVKEGDYVKSHVCILASHKPKSDAQPVLDKPDTWISVHGKDKDFKGHVAGIVVEKLGKELIGKKRQDKVSIQTTGPASHEVEEIRDEPITITIEINSVERLEPASIDDVVGQWGLESSDQLKEQIENMLKDRNEKQQTVAMHEQICDYLLDKIELDLPEGLTSRQSERLLQTQAMELAYSGLDPQEIEEKIAEMRQNSKEKASRQLKRFFILDQAAKSLEIDVSEGEVNGRISAMAVQQGRRPEKLRQKMKQDGELEHLFLQIREQKTLDKILEKAKVQDSPIATKTKKTTTKKAASTKEKAETAKSVKKKTTKKKKTQ